MTPSLPICCGTKAYQLLRDQVDRFDSSDALLNGATAIAMHQLDDIDPHEADARIQEPTLTPSVLESRGRQPQASLHTFTNTCSMNCISRATTMTITIL